MPTKPIASRIAAYKKALASGDIQKTYQTLVGIVQSLRTDFAKAFGDEFAVAHILHGYIDVTYFYLQNAYLKKKKLKFAIVLNHQQVAFELWLLGQTKDVQIRYWESLKDFDWVNENAMPKYSIAEIQLLTSAFFPKSRSLAPFPPADRQRSSLKPSIAEPKLLRLLRSENNASSVTKEASF